MNDRHAHVALALSAIAVLMIAENRISRRHERALRARGAVEPAGDVFAWMRIVYPLAFVVPALEGWMRPGVPSAAWGTGLALFAAAKALKYWAIASLGRLWTFRVLVVPGEPLVRRGPYRWVRHPNYIGVAGEIAGAAMWMGGLLSGAVFTILFGWLMLRRIRIEERALLAASRGHIST
jgi:methyltransferase